MIVVRCQPSRGRRAYFLPRVSQSTPSRRRRRRRRTANEIARRPVRVGSDRQSTNEIADKFPTAARRLSVYRRARSPSAAACLLPNTANFGLSPPVLRCVAGPGGRRSGIDVFPCVCVCVCVCGPVACSMHAAVISARGCVIVFLELQQCSDVFCVFCAPLQDTFLIRFHVCLSLCLSVSNIPSRSTRYHSGFAA